MTVRNTEKRLPEGMQASDFGQAFTSGNYALISYLTSPVVRDTIIDYVVFALNGAPGDKYNWTFLPLSAASAMKEETTDVGINAYTPEHLGELRIVVDVEAGGQSVATLTLSQTVVEPNAQLEALIDGHVIEAGPLIALGGDPQTSREIVNDFRQYIIEAASATGANGIPPIFLAAVAYKESVFRPKVYDVSKPQIVGEFVRSTELELCAQELNDDAFFDIRNQLGNSLGVCQMKPEVAAMVLQLTPWQELPTKRTDRPQVIESIHQEYVNLSLDQKIDLFNRLRFPKTNIRLCSDLLTKLKNRTDRRWPNLTAEVFRENDFALKIVATEYNLGATMSDKATARPTRYGGRVFILLGSPYLRPFFIEGAAPGRLEVTAFNLYDIDNSPLLYLSADEHEYFDGNTRVHGTITIEGNENDRVNTVELEMLQDNSVVARANLSDAASDILLQQFGEDERIEIADAQLMFELSSDETTNIERDQDCFLGLRVRVSTQNGLTARRDYDDVQLLVRYRGALRYGNRDEDRGGDDWILPSVRTILDHFAALAADFRVGDISNMNGGSFAPDHAAHGIGRDVDAHFNNYNNLDANVAQRMIDFLNDVTYGSNITRVYVTFQQTNDDPFWNTIKDVVLNDGRRAKDVITPLAGHDTHFHWRITP